MNQSDYNVTQIPRIGTDFYIGLICANPWNLSVPYEGCEMESIEEAGLLVGDAKLTIDGGKDAFDLTEGEHAAEEGVAGIVAMARLIEDAARLIGERHAMIDTHRETGILLLEDAGKLDEVGTTAQVAGLGEVAVGEDVAAAEVYEVGARSELAGKSDHVVVGSGRERACAEGKAVVLVGHGIEEPADILFGADDARQAKNLDGGIVGVYAHIDAEFLADRHNGLEPVLHVGTELCLVDALVEVEELAELLHGSVVVLAEVAADEALRLDDDVLDELVVLFGSHRLGQFVAFGEHVASFAYALGELELCPLLASAFTLEDIDVEVGKLCIVEVEVGRSVRIVVQQVGACPVEHRHKIVTNGLDAFEAEIAEALFIDLDLIVAVGTSVLDGFDNGE